MRTLSVAFRCNICGTRNRLRPDQISRETGECAGCGSTMRMRSVIRCLSLALYRRSVCLTDLAVDRSISGAGLSDWDGYATKLASLFTYTNTFFHAEPMLDITDPPANLFSALDFVISSDVFEHVAPPVDRAFTGAFNLLKPGGAFIFTVPYGKADNTAEHFPHLNDFEVLEFGPDYYLVNRRSDGEYEVFDDLVFHGGGGQTLEMRVFCEADVLRRLQRSGFEEIFIHRENDPAVGVVHREDWSLPITAVKPGTASIRKPRYPGRLQAASGFLLRRHGTRQGGNPVRDRLSRR
jgi:SAM-dependent methyltransferase